MGCLPSSGIVPELISWLTGEDLPILEPENEKNDHWAFGKWIYVAITPTTVDVTAYHFIDELNKWV